MTRILTSVVLVVLLFPSLALGEKMYNLVAKVNGLYYKKFTDVPFTGEVTGRTQGKLKDGKMEGLWVFYHKNGLLSSKGTYKNGKIEGLWVGYHETGLLRSKGTYKNGKEEGPWVWYDALGTVIEIWTGTFKNGVKVK